MLTSTPTLETHTHPQCGHKPSQASSLRSCSAVFSFDTAGNKSSELWELKDPGWFIIPVFTHRSLTDGSGFTRSHTCTVCCCGDCAGPPSGCRVQFCSICLPRTGKISCTYWIFLLAPHVQVLEFQFHKRLYRTFFKLLKTCEPTLICKICEVLPLITFCIKWKWEIQ